MSTDGRQPGERRGPLRAFLDAPADAPWKMFAVVAAVCLVCSSVVSLTAVTLRPLQDAHREAERSRALAAVFANLPGLESLLGGLGAEAIEAQVVELSSGRTLPEVDPAAFDARAEAEAPERSDLLADEDDPAGIGRRERRALVHLLRADGELRAVVLPVRGNGYQSMLRGYLALSGDGRTILGLSFYEHEETPGLGAEIDDPAWLAGWQGKRVRDDEGRIRVRVVEGDAPEGDPYLVDGISGATFTGDGVSNLVRFWLGDGGFGPWLERLREGETP